MGSHLEATFEYQVYIYISDPDRLNPDDRITKIDIVTDGGEVLKSYEPLAAGTIRWGLVIHDTTHHYFFVRVGNQGGVDAPEAKPGNPVAWLAPVWTGR